MTAEHPEEDNQIGVRFEKVSSSVQASLDRFVFALMRRKAEARRLPSETPEGPSDRRVTPRVEIGPAENLVATLLPVVQGILARSRATEPPRLRLLDLSTTGCGFLCPRGTPLKPQDRVRLQLHGPDLEIELTGRVMHVTPH